MSADAPQTSSLSERDEAELRAVASGLILHDEASVRRRKRLEVAGLIVYHGWDLIIAGETTLGIVGRPK